MAACIPADDPALVSAVATATVQAQPTPTASPTPTPSPIPTATPFPFAPDPTPTEVPTPTATLLPTPSPTPSPTPRPTPTPAPTAAPDLAELDAVSAGIAALMATNGLAAIPNPTTVTELPCVTGTQAMTRFPDTASAVGTPDKLEDPGGDPYTSRTGTIGDKDGYLLFGHDIQADGQHTTIVSYVSFVRSVWCYTVASDGYVRQYNEAGVETPRPPRPTPTPSPTLTPQELALLTPEGELAAVSEAVTRLMLQSGLTSIPNPITAAVPCFAGTQDMTAFPDLNSLVQGDKRQDPFGELYRAELDPEHEDYAGLPGDKDSYLLRRNDVLAIQACSIRASNGG